MVKFKKGLCDGAWICTSCGAAIYPTPENINEHIEGCNKVVLMNKQNIPLNIKEELNDRINEVQNGKVYSAKEATEKIFGGENNVP